MSTVDPRMKAAQRAAQGFGAGGWRLLAAFVLLWLLAGATLAVMLQPFRELAAGVPLDDQEFTFSIVFGAFIAFGLFAGGSIVGAILAKPLGYARMKDVTRRFLRTATAFAAIAMGMVAYWGLWTPPISETGGEQHPAAWVLTELPWWLPPVLLITAVLVLMVPAWRERGRTAKKASRSRVTGTITEVEHTRIAIGGGEGIPGDPVVKVTVKFTDKQGTQRWVTKRAAYHRAGRPNTGGMIGVYFDPERPEKTRRIIVDFPDMHRNR